MLTRIYKNNNFTIKREPDNETAANVEELLYIMANYVDDAYLDYYEPCNYGNSYAVLECTFFVNGKPRYYHLYPEMVETYNSGRVVRMEYREDAPQFIMPSFFDFYPFEYQGVKGTLYKLVNPPCDDTRQFMIEAGCHMFETRAQYAPEIKHAAVFVPNGTCFAFC